MIINSNSILLQILSKQEALYEEVLGVLYRIEQKSTSFDTNPVIEMSYIITIELKNQHLKERVDFHVTLQVHYIVTFHVIYA